MRSTPSAQKKKATSTSEVTKGYLWNRHNCYLKWRSEGSDLMEIHKIRINGFYANNQELLDTIYNALIEIDKMAYKQSADDKGNPVYERDENGALIFHEGFDKDIINQITQRLFNEKVQARI